MIRRKGIFLLSILFTGILLVLAGRSIAAASRQRYRVDNFFDKDFMIPRSNVVFSYEDNIYKIYLSGPPYKTVYEEYIDGQLSTQSYLTSSGSGNLQLYGKELSVTSDEQDSTLIYDITDHLQLIKEVPMAGTSLLGYLSGFYIYHESVPDSREEKKFLVDENGRVLDLKELVQRAIREGEAELIPDVPHSKYDLFICEINDDLVCVGAYSLEEEGDWIDPRYMYSKKDPEKEIALSTAGNADHVTADTENRRWFISYDSGKTLGCIENGSYREILLPDLEEYRKSHVNTAYRDGIFYFLLQKNKYDSPRWGSYNVNQGNLICDALYAFDTETETGKFLYETKSKYERIIGCRDNRLYLLNTVTGGIYRMDAEGRTLITAVSVKYPYMYATTYDGKTVIWGQEKYTTGEQIVLAVI